MCFEEGALCALYLVMFLVLENFLSKICLSNKKLRISTHSLGYSRSLVLNLDIRVSMTIFTSKLFFFNNVYNLLQYYIILSYVF